MWRDFTLTKFTLNDLQDLLQLRLVRMLEELSVAGSTDVRSFLQSVTDACRSANWNLSKRLNVEYLAVM